MSVQQFASRVVPTLLCLAALALIAPACSKKKDDDKTGESAAPANNCTAVGETLARLTALKFDGLEARKKKIMQTQLQLVREEFIATCEKESWSSDIRTCMTTAKDVAAFNQCTAPLRKARGLPPPAAGTAPAPPATAPTIPSTATTPSTP